MDHYLVVVVNDNRAPARKLLSLSDNEDEEDEKDDNINYKTSVLAFNLLDHSLQEAHIKAGLFDYKHDGFIKYDENKILKYSDSAAFSLACITVESFKRNISIENNIFKE